MESNKYSLNKVESSSLESIINSLDWEKISLIPAITQDLENRILMLGYMSKDSLVLSLQSGIMHYFSRSKNRIWKKGEESGNTQKIKEIYIDCDNDTLLFKVEQNGVACHTGEYSCFFKKIDLASLDINKPNSSDKIDSPYHTLDILYHILQDRKNAPATTSYTSSLYANGENAICKKIVEEAGEFCFALKDKNEEEIIYECSDLIYHTLVGLSFRNISPSRVMQELQRRFSISGIEEKNARKK